jgi:hypothetical protein
MYRIGRVRELRDVPTPRDGELRELRTTDQAIRANPPPARPVGQLPAATSRVPVAETGRRASSHG